MPATLLLLTRHHEALQRLARNRVPHGSDLSTALRAACATAADVLGVDRVSVWLYGEGRTSIRCETLFERAEARYSQGQQLVESSCPAYFRALDDVGIIAADDAVCDPRTNELSDCYLKALRIGALLDAPVIVGGRSLGVVCHEHMGGPRIWQPAEMLFAGSIADFVALAIQTQQLDERREELERALIAANMGVWRWDIGSGRVVWNERVGPLFGKPAGWSPASYEDYMSLIPEADRKHVVSAVRAALDAGTGGYLVQHRVASVDGRERWMEGRGQVDRDASGVAIRMRGTVMDITERRELEERLLQARKLEAVGRLAGGVAHDFNNLLTTIGGTADLLRDDLAERPDLLPELEQIVEATARGAALTKQLLTFARRQPNLPVAVEVNGLLTRLYGLLRRILREDLELVLQLADMPLTVSIDPGQLEQVVINLALNARDAMPSGGTLVIATGCEQGAVDRSVVIRVQDTGVGMSDEVKLRAFEPFFTTKDDARGMGLGLATCYGIIQQAKGSLQIESERGRGTALCLVLPLTEELPPTNQSLSPSRVPGGRETLLVVEDEPVVRKLAVRVLSELGYRVLSAINADEARRLAATVTGIDLLITDVVMPGGNGVALAQELRQLGRANRTLLVSGYAFDHLDSEIPSGTQFLPKPFTGRELAACVRSVLDAPPQRSSWNTE